MVQAVVKLFDQMGKRNEFWPLGRNETLGEQDRGGHKWDYIPSSILSRLENEIELGLHHPERDQNHTEFI